MDSAVGDVNPLQEDEFELSAEDRKELKRRVADMESAVRYVVYSDISGTGRWRLWLDISSDGYWDTIDRATLFKRQHVAEAVATAYSDRRDRSYLYIAKITTKNGKRKVLKYLDWTPNSTVQTSAEPPPVVPPSDDPAY